MRKIIKQERIKHERKMKQMEFQVKPNLEVGGIKNPNKIEMAF
jgi:hypothetical protein